MTQAVLIAHAFATLGMAGLVLFVQVVHYPLFAKVGAEAFGPYEIEHQSRTTLVVAPLMFLELGSAAWIAVFTPDGVPAWAAWLGLVLVGVVWALTFFVAVPLHRKLLDGFDAAAHRRLVLANWPRTVVWCGRGVLSLLMLSWA